MDNEIKIEQSFCFLCAFLMLTIPLRWVLAVLLSALVHELCHIAAIKLCGKKILSVNIGMFGAEIQTEMLSGYKEILCIGAGPAGSFLLLLLFRWLPLTALAGMIQGLFNLLPFRPLDGGRILSSMFCLAFGQDCAAWIMNVIELLSVIAFAALVIYWFSVLKFSKLLLMLTILLIINLLLRKIPCKLPQLRVQ